MPAISHKEKQAISFNSGVISLLQIKSVHALILMVDPLGLIHDDVKNKIWVLITSFNVK